MPLSVVVPASILVCACFKVPVIKLVYYHVVYLLFISFNGLNIVWGWESISIKTAATCIFSSWSSIHTFLQRSYVTIT